MKKSVLVTTASALMLTACACNPPDVRNTNPHYPSVSVVDGKYIVVDPDPLYFPKEAQNVKITWQLPTDSKYTFPRDGIVIKDAGDEFPDCHPEQNGLRFACMNKHTKPGRYKYTIKVEGLPAVPPLDPIVAND
jgi:hypothetical protein